MNDNTIAFYNKHAEDFTAGTENADMGACRARFLAYLEPGQKILDAGCGSGRDILAFRDAGYEADGFDASYKMCRIAANKTGAVVRCLRFEEVEGIEEYDGIWACASLLHVDAKELPDALRRLKRILKAGGVLYASFKYGSGERVKDGRYFRDMTEDECTKHMEDAGLTIEELFITQDVRPGRAQEKWINLIARK